MKQRKKLNQDERRERAAKLRATKERKAEQWRLHLEGETVKKRFENFLKEKRWGHLDQDTTAEYVKLLRELAAMFDLSEDVTDFSGGIHLEVERSRKRAKIESLICTLIFNSVDSENYRQLYIRDN